jgi:hypothetical protein
MMDQGWRRVEDEQHVTFVWGAWPWLDREQREAVRHAFEPNTSRGVRAGIVDGIAIAMGRHIGCQSKL